MRKSSEKGKDNHSVNDLEEVVVMKEKELTLGEEILYQLNEYFTEDEISSIDGNEKFVDRDSSLEIDILDNIGNITTSNAHNGRIISDINYNPDIRYLVTNSVTDKSIIGWKIVDDKILQNRYFKYTDSDFLADLDKKKRFSAHLDDVYKNRYVILRNHYNCYCRVLDLTKGRYLKFPTNMNHKYVKGFFVDNKSKELMMIKEYGSHNSYKGTDQVRFYKFKIDDETDQLIYETTYYLYCDEYPSINCKSEELLIANPNTSITNWDKKKLKYKHDYDILYRYGEVLVYNNNKSMVAIVYNSIKKIITFSLENNRMYSSLDYKRDKTVKKLLFINTEDKSEEYLLVVMYCNSKKNLEYRLIDPYNLGNSMDITDYFNENVLSVSGEDAGVTIGPVVADNKIIVISNVNDVVTLGGGDSCSSGFSATSATTNGSSSINFNAASMIDTVTSTVSVNHIYIKEVIDKDKLDMSNLVLQSKKAAYLDKKITSLGNVIHNYDPPERIVTLQQEGSTLSSVKWVIEYDENFNNIIVSVQVFVNEHGEECWRTIDTYDLEAQERFLYCELVKAHLLLVSNSCVYVFEILIHDDQNYVHVDEIGYESKIRMIYYREITYKNRKIKLRTRYRYDTIEEKVVNIYGIFDDINKTYVSNKKIPRQPLREALRNLLNEFYSFEKYGRKVLKEALDRDNSLIVEEILNSYLYWFKKDSNSNISILGGIISELPRMEKHDHRLLSRFFAQTSMLLLMSNPITSNYDTLYTAYTQELFIYQKGSFWRFYYHFIRRVEELIKGKKSARKISNVIKQPAVHLIIPYPGFMSYPRNYSFFDELMYRPATNVFIELEHEEIYKHSTYKTILDFKWNTFGFNYYMGIWIIYTIFLLIFAVATTTERQQFSEHHRDVLLINSVVFGSAHFFFEARQFTWNPKKYILDFWNCFDLGAYLLPVITSSYWLIHEPPPVWLISASNLLMDLKFMLFLRGIKYFGNYFAIILGVAKKVFSFLLILFLIIVSFSHALYILLRPDLPYHLEHPDFNDDPNNPWNLVRRYITINTANDSYDDRTIFSDIPDGDTNMFTYFPSSLLAMYSFLTGDNSAVAAWSIQNDPYLAILVVIFSFIVVVYLMNLFIGLLSNAIEENNTEEAFLAEKAKIIKEIELFCLFPNQRRWRNWFPEILHYPVSIEDVRKGIKEVDESKRKDSNSIPFISDELRNLVGMPEPPKKETSILTVVDNRLEKNEKKLMKQMQILLDEIKILKNNDDDQFS